MRFDWTISLSSLITAGTILGGGWGLWMGFRTKVDLLLQVHRELIDSLNERFDQHEVEDNARFKEVADQFRESNKEVSAQFSLATNRMIDITSGLQRLIGRDEFRQRPRT